MDHPRSGNFFSRVWAPLLIGLSLLCCAPATAQLEPTPKTDWRFHAGRHWVGLVEYTNYNSGKTYIQLPGSVRFLSPVGIRFTAFLIFVVPTFGVAIAILGIRNGLQFFRKEKNPPE